MANEPKMHDLTTRHGCVQYVAELRHCARLVVRTRDQLHEYASLVERQARLLRKQDSPMLARRADTLDSTAAALRAEAALSHEHLLGIGEQVLNSSAMIHARVPQAILLDLLNVNAADRGAIRESDGLVEVVYLHGLENSAEHRHKEWKDSPLFQAVNARAMQEMIDNDQLRRRMHEKLFGAGGMFEFLPTFTVQSDGSMQRNPPRLRLADAEIDSMSSGARGGSH